MCYGEPDRLLELVMGALTAMKSFRMFLLFQLDNTRLPVLVLAELRLFRRVCDLQQSIRQRPERRGIDVLPIPHRRVERDKRRTMPVFAKSVFESFHALSPVSSLAVCIDRIRVGNGDVPVRLASDGRAVIAFTN